MAFKCNPTDAGKSAAGFGHERNDCTVRALANVTGMPYTEAYNFLRSCGRPANKGWYTESMLDRAQQNGILTCKAHEYFRPTVGFGYPKRMSLSRAMARMRTGRWLVKTRRHVFAVIDGVIYDTYPDGPRKQVRGIFEITLPEPKSAPATQDQINELWERLNRLENKL